MNHLDQATIDNLREATMVLILVRLVNMSDDELRHYFATVFNANIEAARSNGYRHITNAEKDYLVRETKRIHAEFRALREQRRDGDRP